MSLVKKPAKTEKQLAANRRNQKLCHGPATDERRERMRAALLRSGYNAQAEEIAMRALGEDPAHFQELLEELWEEWNPAGALQEGVVIALGRAMWLMNRAARMQEGYAVRQAQEVNSGRQDRLHAKMMRLTMTAESLGRLVQSVAHERYVTTPADLEKMKNLHQDGVVEEMAEIALALFCQLQAPGTGEDGLDAYEKARRMVAQAKEIFGIGMSAPFAPPSNVAPASSRPREGQQDAGATQESQQDADAVEQEEDKRYPNITAAEWEARERPRHLLENILKRQVEICEARRKAVLRETLRGPSPYERAADIAPTHPNARVMRRMQDSNLREVRRLTNLLLRIKRYQRQTKGLEETAGFHDVPEIKGVSV